MSKREFTSGEKIPLITIKVSEDGTPQRVHLRSELFDLEKSLVEDLFLKTLWNLIDTENDKRR